MKKTLLLCALSTLLFSNPDYIWSKDTQAMSQDKSDKILQSYKDGDADNLTFKDDPKRKNDTVDFKENIFVLGLSLGADSYSQEVSNAQGSYFGTHSATNVKFTIAKDYTLWHEEYTQPSRLYFAFALTQVDTNVDYRTWTIGLRENMYYWPLYKSSTYSIYPNASFEIGSSNINRGNSSMSGFTSQVEFGLTYSRNSNFEYFLDARASSITWKHEIDGVADEMSGVGISFGLNYKLMYGDFQ